MGTDTITSRSIATAEGLRRLAAWIDAHPDLAECVAASIEVSAYPTDSPENVAEWARALAPAEKEYNDTLFKITRSFGKHVSLSAVFWRQTVCKRVVTGVRHVPERVIEAHDVEIVEWECESPILALPRPDAHVVIPPVDENNPTVRFAPRVPDEQQMMNEIRQADAYAGKDGGR